MKTLFAETLRKLRKEKGLSQIQLGRQMYVNNSTINRWESGSRLPDVATISRLARILQYMALHSSYERRIAQHHHGG